MCVDIDYESRSERIHEDLNRIESKDVLYKLNATDGFLLSFALEDFSEFVFIEGFKKGFQILESFDGLQSTRMKMIKVLYDYSKNHSTEWSSEFETIIEYFLERN